MIVKPDTIIVRERCCFTPRSGVSKIGYVTRAEVRRAQRRVFQKHGDRLQPYYCDTCGRYHLGHPRTETP